MKIGFSYPIKLDAAQHQMYKDAGLDFQNQGPRGYSEVVLDALNNKTSERMAQLTSRALSELTAHFQDTDLKPHLERAKGLHVINKQCKPWFGLEADNRPLAWEIHDKIPDEIKRLDQELKTLGIDEVRVGVELEFHLPEEPLTGFNKWHDVKAQIIQELEQAVEDATTDDEKAKQQTRLAQAHDFNAREVLMYDLIEREPVTRGLLEQLFGQTRDGDGYYDAEGTLELKIAHGDVTELPAKRKTVLNALYQKAAEFGLPLMQGMPGQHESFSFWKDGQNLLDDQHPEFATTGKAIAEGMTRVAFDAFPLLVDDYKVESEKSGAFDLSVNREQLLRAASGRIEARFNNHPSEQNGDLMLAVIMAGAAHRLSMPEDTAHIAPAETVQNGHFRHTRDQFKLLSHVLSNAIIGEDGKLQVPENYVHKKADTIGCELGIQSQETPDYIKRFGITIKMAYTDGLIAFLNKIRIEETTDGLQIHWPETEPGHYTIHVPDQSMEQLPPAMQVRMRAGEEVSDAEMRPYLIAGTPPPKPAHDLTIDIKTLRENIQIMGVSAKYVVTDGYDADTIIEPDDQSKGMKPLAYSRRQRMCESKALKAKLDPTLFDAITQALHNKYAPPPPPPEVSAADKDYVRAILAEFKNDTWREVFDTMRLQIHGIACDDPDVFQQAVKEVLQEELEKAGNITPENAILRFSPSGYREASFLVQASPEVYAQIILNMEAPSENNHAAYDSIGGFNDHAAKIEQAVTQARQTTHKISNNPVPFPGTA